MQSTGWQEKMPGEQECILVGCVPTAALTTRGGGVPTLNGDLLWMETLPRCSRRSPPPKKRRLWKLAVGKNVKNPEFILTCWPDVYSVSPPPPPQAGVRSGREWSIEVIYFFTSDLITSKYPLPSHTLLRSLDLKICRDFTVGYWLVADRRGR